jgi:hypothetical protein
VQLVFVGFHCTIYSALPVPSFTKAFARCNFNDLRTEIAQHLPCQAINPANSIPFRNGNFFR